MVEEHFEDCINDDNLTENIKYKFKSIRGITKYTSKSGNFTLKEITIENLLNCFSQNIIIIPSIQRDIDQSKIDQMIVTYKEDNESFNFLTNSIQLIYMSDYNKYLLIDGQHRFHMYKKLLELLFIQNNYKILVNITKSNDKEYIYNMYTQFNYDIRTEIKTIENFKLNFDTIFTDLDYKIFNSMYCKNIIKYFAKEQNPLIYTFTEFYNILYDKEYIEKFKTVQDAYEYIIDTNRIFYKKFYCTVKIKKSIVFPKEEMSYIDKKIIFNLKQNNYIDLILNHDIIDQPFKASHIIIDGNSEQIITLSCDPEL